VSVAAVWTLTRVQRLIRRPAGDPAGLVAGTMTGLAQFHLNRSDVGRIVWSAFRNWGFDLLCLAFSIKAAGVHVPWWGIILAWAAGAGGASLNPTRGITFWLAIAIGWPSTGGCDETAPSPPTRRPLAPLPRGPRQTVGAVTAGVAR
jgi:hypothetical protein